MGAKRRSYTPKYRQDVAHLVIDTGRTIVEVAREIGAGQQSGPAISALTNIASNGLLRQYFPKGSDLGVHTFKHLPAVKNELNSRTRVALDDRTPLVKRVAPAIS